MVTARVIVRWASSAAVTKRSPRVGDIVVEAEEPGEGVRFLEHLVAECLNGIGRKLPASRAV